MRDGEHAIYITLNHFGPLSRDLVFQLLDQGKGHFDKKYLETCLEFLEEDGIVSVGDTPESILTLTLKKIQHKGKREEYDHKNHKITSTREKGEKGTSEEERYIADLLKKPYSRMFVYDDDVESYGAAILEFTGCVSMGATVAEANKNLDEAAKSWIVASLDMGNTIPEPRETSNDDYNGRILLRVPRYIHAKAVRYAALENTSLNQFILSALCLQLGETVKKKKKGNSKEITHYRMDVNCDYEYGKNHTCFKCQTKSITVYMQGDGTTWCRDCIEKEMK